MKRFSTVVTMVLVLLTLLSFCVFACAEETVNLIWWTYSDSGDAPTALKDVLERANAISSEKIGVTVDLLMKTGSQVSLDLNTGEFKKLTPCVYCGAPKRPETLYERYMFEAQQIGAQLDEAAVKKAFGIE